MEDRVYTYDEAETEAAQRIQAARGKEAGDAFFSDCTILSDLAPADPQDYEYSEQNIAEAVQQFLDWYDAEIAEADAINHDDCEAFYCATCKATFSLNELVDRGVVLKDDNGSYSCYCPDCPDDDETPAFRSMSNAGHLEEHTGGVDDNR